MFSALSTTANYPETVPTHTGLQLKSLFTAPLMISPKCRIKVEGAPYSVCCFFFIRLPQVVTWLHHIHYHFINIQLVHPDLARGESQILWK